MKHFYVCILLLTHLFTWAQKNYETEQIIWQGKTHPYRYHHMEQYFAYYPNKRPAPNKDTTILNRNYIALFEIKDDKFYLNDLLIKGNNSSKKDVSVYKQFASKDEPIYLNWITGLFDIGLGTEKIQKNDSLTPLYDNYIVFEIKKGTLGRVEYFTYNQLKLFKDYQYNRFKQTVDYQRLHQRFVVNGMSEQEASQHIYEFILFYSKSNFLQKRL